MDAVKGIGKDHAKFSPVGVFIQQSIDIVRLANAGFEVNDTRSPEHNPLTKASLSHDGDRNIRNLHI